MLLESQLLEWCFARNSCYLVHWFSIFLRKHFKPSSSMLIYWKLPDWKRGISQKVTLTLDFKKKFKTDKIYTSLGGKCQILSWWKYNVSLHMMRSIAVEWAQSLKIYILLNNNICQLNLHIHEHFEHLFKYSILAPISIHKAPSCGLFILLYPCRGLKLLKWSKNNWFCLQIQKNHNLSSPAKPPAL